MNVTCRYNMPNEWSQKVTSSFDAGPQRFGVIPQSELLVGTLTVTNSTAKLGFNPHLVSPLIVAGASVR